MDVNFFIAEKSCAQCFLLHREVGMCHVRRKKPRESESAERHILGRCLPYNSCVVFEITIWKYKNGWLRSSPRRSEWLGGLVDVHAILLASTKLLPLELNETARLDQSNINKVEQKKLLTKEPRLRITMSQSHAQR